MLSVNDLLEAAKAQSGLADFGNMNFDEGLRVLADSINKEAGISAANEPKVAANLVRTLVNRLRMQRDLTRHPEILEEEILPPVYITSLPRTGSTKLQRLLAATGKFNAMLFWQGYHFAPFDANERPNPDPRIADAERYLEWIRAKAPLFMEAHPMYADEVEEELFLLDAGFNSLYNHASYLHVPSYVQWVLELDPTEAFHDLRRILQYLQWQHFPGTRRRWVLKTPALLGTEATFVKVFPGTDFIVTHRHPRKIMGSVCALFCGIRELYNDHSQDEVAGPTMMYSFGVTSNAHLQWRASYPKEKVMDVRIEEVMSDEHALVQRIFDFLGMDFDEEARAGVAAWIEKDNRRRETPRQFVLADYGLDEVGVDVNFAPYIERYAKFL